VVGIELINDKKNTHGPQLLSTLQLDVYGREHVTIPRTQHVSRTVNLGNME